MFDLFLKLKEKEALKEWCDTHPEEIRRINRELMSWKEDKNMEMRKGWVVPRHTDRQLRAYVRNLENDPTMCGFDGCCQRGGGHIRGCSECLFSRLMAPDQKTQALYDYLGEKGCAPKGEYWEMFGKKKKNEMPELKGGMLVKLADGVCALMCDKDTGWRMGRLNGDVYLQICVKINADDVVEIYPGNFVYGVLDNSVGVSRHLIWKRKETVKEMTVEEIEKALGHKVKIVKG